jgi:hypothetical protein
VGARGGPPKADCLRPEGLGEFPIGRPHYRSMGTGPPGYRGGRYIRWRRSEVDAWLEQQRDPT